MRVTSGGCAHVPNGSAGSSRCSSLAGALGTVQPRRRSRRCRCRSISWRVENSFRFFTDAADTEVHRATYPRAAARGPAAAADPRRRAGAERAPRGRLGGDDVPRHVLGRAHQPLRLQRRQRLHQSEIASRRRCTIDNIDEAAGLSCTWLTAPHGGSAARRCRDAAVQRRGALRHSLSRRRDA